MTTPTLVVKYGGNAIEDTSILPKFAQAIASVKAKGYNVIIVHGGGPQINHWLQQTQCKSHFVDGLRYTDQHTLDIVEMTLCAHVNKAIVRAGLAAGLNCVGISGQDAHTLSANQQPQLGLVGNIEHTNNALIAHLLSGGYTPVIAPLGLSASQQALNINADYSAAHIAGAFKAQHFILMTNVSALLDKNGQRLAQVNSHDIQALIADKTIYGGMLPKIDCAMTALKQQCEKVSIIDGTNPDNLLTLLNNPNSIGTEIIF